MITDQKKQILNQFLEGLSKEQIAFASGYLAGLSAEQHLVVAKPLDINIEATILYVSETGNSKKIAGDLAVKIKSVGGKAKLKAAEQYRFSDLVKEKYLILIASTHGDGEIPENGKGFYNYLLHDKPDLSDLQYAILALGDSNYPLFCEAGKIFDEEFKKLNAREFSPKLNLDLDFEDFINDWHSQILQGFSGDKKQITGSSNTKKSTKKSNYKGKILNNIILNDVGSNKEVHHIEISAEGLHYEVGDALAIKINNNAPRMYSIASSILANEDEAHLTVAKLENGICSSYLAGLQVGDELEFYISKNNNFRLPDDDKNIIMVGPGTGIAPFRGFLQQRDASNSAGKNWLFFGDQHAHTDFLYQAELLEYKASGLLTEIDVAFSRDQAQKIYVQNRMQENAVELAKWLKDGAYFYVCGDKENMAKDVEETLIEIVGADYLSVMKEEGRYLRDVY